MEKNKRNTIVLVSIIVILTIIYFAFFFWKKNNIENNISMPDEPVGISREIDSNSDIEKNIIISNGQITKVNKNTIEVAFYTAKEKIIETFTISTTNPKTPTTKGDADNRKDADIIDLRPGQEITIEYDKENKDIININIKEE